ncbi:hypothetical protein D3C71_1427390 [compost metagenome]
MRKVIKKPPQKKRSPSVANRNVALELTASERRILQLIVTGIEEEPDGVLAGASFKFSQ